MVTFISHTDYPGMQPWSSRSDALATERPQVDHDDVQSDKQEDNISESHTIVRASWRAEVVLQVFP